MAGIYRYESGRYENARYENAARTLSGFCVHP